MTIGGLAVREKVVDAALQLARDGVGAITIASLTDASGVSNGSIYHHFGSREGVLAATVDRVFGQAMTAARPALREPDTERAIADFVRRYVGWVATHRAAALVLYHAPLELQGVAVSEAKLEAFAPLAGWLSARMASGDVREVDLALADPICFGPVHETCRRWLAHPKAFDLLGLSGVLGQAVAAILLDCRESTATA